MCVLSPVRRARARAVGDRGPWRACAAGDGRRRRGDLVRRRDGLSPPRIRRAAGRRRCSSPRPTRSRTSSCASLGETSLFAARFRENAARALLLPRRHPGRRSPLWAQRKRAADLLAVASRYGSFPILLETYRECLRDVFDLPGLVDLLRRDRVAADPRRHRRLAHAVARSRRRCSSPTSPTSSTTATRRSPSAGRRRSRSTRRSCASCSARRSCASCSTPTRSRALERSLQRLEGHRGPPRRRTARPAALARRSERKPRSRARSPGAGSRVRAGWRLLREQRRIVRGPRRRRAALRGGRGRRAAARRARGRAAAGAAGRVPRARGRSARRTSCRATRAPTARFASTTWRRASASRPGMVADRARSPRGAAAGRRGRLPARAAARASGATPNVLRAIKRRSLAKLRREVEPVEPARVRALPRGVAGRSRAPRAGPDALLSAVEQLQGAPIPASVLETEVLPARVGRLPAGATSMRSAPRARSSGAGVEPLGPSDGRIALYLPDRRAAARTARGARRGRARWPRRSATCWPRAARSSSPISLPRPAPSPATSLTALWDLVWSGEVTNDTLAPLRSLRRAGSAREARRARTASRFARAASARPAARGAGRWWPGPERRRPPTETERRAALAAVAARPPRRAHARGRGRRGNRRRLLVRLPRPEGDGGGGAGRAAATSSRASARRSSRFRARTTACARCARHPEESADD